jgi:RNA polymerase primary sigma factor
MGTSRGYLTYEEMNTKLPTRSSRPDKLDSLLMMIDEMGIKLIGRAGRRRVPSQAAQPHQDDRQDHGHYGGRRREFHCCPAAAAQAGRRRRRREAIDEEEEEVDIAAIEKELAESTKRIDDPVRMYLTQMGEIPLLTREQEIALAKKIEITRKIFRSKVLESDYCLQAPSRSFSRWTTATCRSTAR